MLSKKRLRYKTNAAKIAAIHNISIDLNNWNEVWDLLEKYGEPEYVYFIGSQESREVKIGKSKNPGQRLKALQTGYPEKLKLFCFFDNKSPFSEKELHKKFKHLHKQGEWFLYNQELRDFVEEWKRCRTRNE